MTMRTFQARLRKSFGRYGFYQRLRTSLFSDLYRRLQGNGSIIRQRQAEVSFYRSTLQGLRKGDLIFDIGANGGDKADVFLRLGARVLAVEPDETNQEVLAQRFLRLRLFKRPVRIVGKAVSDSQRTEKMWMDAPGSALNTLSRKWVDALRTDAGRFGTALTFGEARSIETTTLEDLIDSFGAPFYAKIDVEGHEAAVIRGLNRPVPYVSFEVNLPQFRPEGLECIARLNQIDAKAQYNYTSGSVQTLVLSQWVRAGEFVSIFDKIVDSSVEVFAAMRLPPGR